jgi:proteic killer suppression protein
MEIRFPEGVHSLCAKGGGVPPRFRDRDTQRLAQGHHVCAYSGIARHAARRLVALQAATSLEDLRSQRGNRLEALKGDRAGQFSIRINDQYRICFEWPEAASEPFNIEIVDYH